jgi:hypothetical protein
MPEPPCRRWCSELVSVVCRLDGGWRLAVSANLEEIGESSVLVLTQTRIRLGTRITLDCKTRELKGVVESCVLDEILGFFVEIRLDPDCHWSPQWFAPQHLLPSSTFRPKLLHLA